MLPHSSGQGHSPLHATDTISFDSSVITRPESDPSYPPSLRREKRPLTPSNLSGSTRPKHPRTLAYPQAGGPGTKKRAQATTPVGTSKQALSKRKANESVHNGTFVLDPKRWDAYKKKLARLDPDFGVVETDPSSVLSVQHSVCGGWFTMGAPYNKERFKEHVESCSYSTSMGRIKTLENFGVIVFPANARHSASGPLSLSSTPPPVRASCLPCPGLTESNSVHIPQYLARTSVASAGGEDIHAVAASLFHDEFRNLSSDKKDLVRLKQKKTHTWSVDHLMKTVHAIGKVPCIGDAQVATDGSLEPCKACKALLSSAAFKKAIARKPAPNENRAYIPHVYQPPQIGKMYSLGFSDLINGVSSIHG